MDLKKKSFYPLPTALSPSPSDPASWSLSITFELNRSLSSVPFRLKSAAEKLNSEIRLKAKYVRNIVIYSVNKHKLYW
jgi:hypothetical protein